MLLTAPGEIQGAELHRRDVDGHFEGGAAGQPCRALAACRGQHPLAQRMDQARAFGLGNEGGRCQMAAVGTAKPEQRLDLDQALMRQLENGLIHQIERLVLKGRSQFALQPAAAPQLAVEVAAVGLEATAPGRLGPIEGDVGVADQLFRRMAVVRVHGDTQAAGDVHLPAIEIGMEARAPPRSATPSPVRRRLLQALLHQRELVAAEPGPSVAGAGDGLEAVGDLAQQRVAGQMAERVVDLLELVEIEQHHRHCSRRRLARAMAWLRRSWNSVRLGSPVNGSCRARCRTRSSAAFRSVMSTAAPRRR